MSCSTTYPPGGNIVGFGCNPQLLVGAAAPRSFPGPSSSSEISFPGPSTSGYYGYQPPPHTYSRLHAESQARRQQQQQPHEADDDNNMDTMVLVPISDSSDLQNFLQEPTNNQMDQACAFAPDAAPAGAPRAVGDIVESRQFFDDFRQQQQMMHIQKKRPWESADASVDEDFQKIKRICRNDSSPVTHQPSANTYYSRIPVTFKQPTHNVPDMPRCTLGLYN